MSLDGMDGLCYKRCIVLHQHIIYERLFQPSQNQTRLASLVLNYTGHSVIQSPAILFLNKSPFLPLSIISGSHQVNNLSDMDEMYCCFSTINWAVHKMPNYSSF